MEPYEIEFPEQEPQPVPISQSDIPQSDPFSAKTAREAVDREPEILHEPVPAEAPPLRYSPFADSPYEMPTPQPATPVKAKKPHKKIWKPILAGLLVLALVAAGCGITAASVNSYWRGQSTQTQYELAELQAELDSLRQQIKDNSYTGTGNSVSGTPNTSPDGLTPAQVYAKCVKSVVAIANQATTTNIYGQVSQTASSGSGFILSEDGYVVTNYHVIEGATKLTVILHDGTEYEAKAVGQDATNDIAVLKVEATGLPAVTLGSSDALIVGDQVVAIGNPLGELTNTLTVGYVSAKERSVTTDGAMINMLQTDAAINPGNSGGPLFNMKGQVVGITTAKYSGTTASGASIEGVGFAIPIDDVVKKIDNLRQFGYVSPAYLGVMVSDMNPTVADTYGMPMGAYVREVTPGFCAEAAGIRAKDIITAIGGHKVSSLNSLSQVLLNFAPGDTTTVTVWRSGKILDLPITLDQNPQSTKG